MDTTDDHVPERKAGVGPIELARIAARGIGSLFRPAPATAPVPPTTAPATTIVSPDTAREVRIPPGQVRTKKWPVLHAGTTPRIDLATWDLRVFGLVETPVRLTWDEFRALPTVRVVADMHCVTRWSRLDNAWEGVAVGDVVRRARPSAEARFVVIHCEQGYSTNLPIDEFIAEDCLFATGHDGQPLTADHGGPVRLVVPRLYAWKSAKWVRAIEFLEADRPGFWERNGYHNHGDPWAVDAAGKAAERFG